MKTYKQMIPAMIIGSTVLSALGNGVALAGDIQIARKAILDRTLPRHAELQAMRRVLAEPLQQGRAVGYAAESAFVHNNSGWNLVGKANAPQNDVYMLLKRNVNDGITRTPGTGAFATHEFIGGQIKAYRSGDPKAYAKAMLKDHQAKYFLIPDDHVPALRREILKHINTFTKRGQIAKAARWRRQLERVRGLGKTYKQLQRSVITAAKRSIRRVAFTTGAASGGLVIAIDGGIVLYDAAQGHLTPQEVKRKLAESGIKGVSVGAATTIAVLAGASPAGITVFVVGTVTYVVVNYAIKHIDRRYTSTPMTVEQIAQFMPKRKSHTGEGVE